MILPQLYAGKIQDGEDSATLISSGSVVRLRMPEPGGAFAVETSGKTPGGGVTRGIIRGRSKASRRRFQQSMGRVDLSGIQGVMLLTLTFREVPSHEAMARMLDNVLKWLLRVFGNVPVAWAKERGKVGGRWHFHLVVFARDYVNAAKYQRAWNRIAGRFAGNVDVAFKQDAAVVRYLAKYLSKEVGVWQDAAPGRGVEAGQETAPRPGAVDLDTAHISPKEGHTGRTWGWRFYKSLPLHPVKARKIPVQVAHQVRRTLARLHKADLRARFERWRDWTVRLLPDSDVPIDDIPGWVFGMARREHIQTFQYCGCRCREAAREYARFLRYGSHLARGAYDKRGWSFFAVGDASPLLDRLSAYYEGLSHV